MQPIVSEVLAPVTLLLPPIILAIENDADRDYLTQIYLDYRNLIYKVALSFFPDDYSEVEDAFSMTLEKMCRRPELIRAVPNSRKASYISTMTANTCRDRLRQKKSGIYAYDVEDSVINQIADPVDPYAHLFEYSSITEIIETWQSVTDNDRDVIRMRYEEEKTIPEMAEILGVKEATVYSALFRARKHVIDHLRKEEQLL